MWMGLIILLGGYLFIRLNTNTKDKPDLRPYSSEISLDKVDIECGDGADEMEVVGESNYIRTMWRYLPKSVGKGKFRVKMVFTLRDDSSNPHDNNAVSVTIGGDVVGYLSRADARSYRRWASANKRTVKATCRGVVVGDYPEGYGIWLEMPSEAN